MKMTLFLATAFTMVLTLSSCGSSKKAADNYYNIPRGNTAVGTTENNPAPRGVTKTERAVDELQQLAEESNTHFRAVGVANRYREGDARLDAIENAQDQIATLIERGVAIVTSNYSQIKQVDSKKKDESDNGRIINGIVSQVVKNCRVIKSKVYDVSDGSIEYRVCIEVVEPKEVVIGKVYDQLTKDEVIGVDYDKNKFIEDNKEQIEKSVELLNSRMNGN